MTESVAVGLEKRQPVRSLTTDDQGWLRSFKGLAVCLDRLDARPGLIGLHQGSMRPVHHRICAWLRERSVRRMVPITG